METMLKFRCDGCEKEFIVMDHQVDTDALACPHCPASSARPKEKGGSGRCHCPIRRPRSH